MAIDKDFVIKNGLQVNDNLIYADPNSDKVGIGTTQADKKLFVKGDSEITQSLTVGTGLSAVDGKFTGIITSNNGLDVGVGGSALSVDVSNKRIGVNSTSPEYTVDIRGPVSTGTNAAYIFGDVEVTGSVTAANFTGQVQGGGNLTLNNLTVNADLVGNDANVYTFFKVNRFGGNNRYRFVPRDTSPVAIGFTENTDNPTIYLNRGQNYRFELDSSNSPFYIKTQPTVGLDDLYQDGVENNGVEVGILTFKVPYNAPNILYYQSSEFSGGGGKIILNSDAKSTTTETLTVTNLIDSQNQAEFDNVNITGVTTINELKGPNNFSVSSGVLTINQVSGVSTGANAIKVTKTNGDTEYQLVFSPKNDSYQELYIDEGGNQLEYNPSTNKLTVGSLEIRSDENIAGVSTGANDILVDISNEPQKYDIAFINNNGTNYRRILKDSVFREFSYNPNSSTLFVPNITATTVTAPTLAGVATGASKIGVTSDTTFPNNGNSRILFITNANPDNTRSYEVFSNKDLKYNRGKGILFAGGFNGVGSTITNLNADNIDRGVVGVDFLPDASTTEQGVVQLTDDINTTDSTIAATATAVKTAYDAAVENVPLSRLPKASTDAQGVVRLNNTVTSTSTSRAATPKALKFVFDTAIGVIPEGTAMLFYNPTAPTGWTKDTDANIDDTALRVTSAGVDQGGTTRVFSSDRGFSEVFKSDIDIPLKNHQHYLVSQNDANDESGKNPIVNNQNKAIASKGFGGSGTELERQDYVLEAAPDFETPGLPVPRKADRGKSSEVVIGTELADSGDNVFDDPQLDFNVNYVNVIICRKDAYSTNVPE